MFDGIASLALDELRQRSQARVYQTDPEAWMADLLGVRLWSKQSEIASAFVSHERSAVKSANGCGKSALGAALVSWWCSVFPVDETLAIVSAPTLSQIEKVIFAYLKNNFASAKLMGSSLRGEISEELTWKVVNPVTGKKDFLAFGKRPTDKDVVSSFQGTRKLRTFVLLDEAGGVPRELFTAAEAVTTGAESRLLAIGNPDHRGTEFHNIFTRPEMMAEFWLGTISAFDLPTFTGERVYADPVKEDVFQRSMTSKDWVEHKRRVWGEGDARWMSKVMGEFPTETDNTFFGQTAIDRGVDLELPDDGDVRPVLGVDVARFGEDESVIFTNRAGRVRLYDSWGKTDTVVSARRIHSVAHRVDASEVRIDASGIGGAVFDMLDSLEEFADRRYVLIGVDGAARSPDPAQWANMRSYNHDCLRRLLLDGKVDLDFDDRELRDQLLMVTYRFNNRGAVQITPKDELRGVMGGSPDRLDACIYAVTDLGGFLDSGKVERGDRVVFDPADILQMSIEDAGMPW